MYCSTSWSPVYVLGHLTEIDTSNETANDPKKIALKKNDNLITFASWKIQYIVTILIDCNEENVFFTERAKRTTQTKQYKTKKKPKQKM